MVSRSVRKKRIVVALAAALALSAVLAPSSASAAGPFKSVAIAGISPTQMRISGGLDVTKKCRADRTIDIFGSNLFGPFQNLPKLGAVESGRSGSWSKVVAQRDHYVLILHAKRVKGKLCPGGAFLVEAGGPT